MTFELRDGTIVRDGSPFTSIGFNYHPPTAGCGFWRDWDPDEVERDLAHMSRLGFNTVRFFVFWRDFEPIAAEISDVALARLDQFVRIADELGLACVISLLTLWMNGEVLDLAWRDQRSLWDDDWLIEREKCFVQELAQLLAERPNILAYDLGDEIVHVDRQGAAGVSKSNAARWQNELRSAIREQDPNALVMQANEASCILEAWNSFGPHNGSELDLAAVHGFPPWVSVAIESYDAYKATILPGFLACHAGASAPPFIDEIGTYGTAPDRGARFLEAAGTSALVNGATGVLAWCWRDISSENEPYVRHPLERHVGVVDLDGNRKPTLGGMVRVNETRTQLQGTRGTQPTAAIYVARGPRGTTESYLSSQKSNDVATFYAYILCKRAHIPVEFTRDFDPGYRLIVCPSVTHLSLVERSQMREYVNGGGTLYLSAGDYLDGFGGEALTGLRLLDYTLEPDQQARFEVDDQRFDIRWPTDDHGIPKPIPVVSSIEAQVLSTYPNGAPALTLRKFGKGSCVYLNAPFELQLDAPYRVTSRRWHLLYEKLAGIAGVQVNVTCSDPDIEVAPRERADGRRVIVLVNHANEARSPLLELRRDGLKLSVALKEKGTLVYEPGPSAVDPAGMGRGDS